MIIKKRDSPARGAPSVARRIAMVEKKYKISRERETKYTQFKDNTSPFHQRITTIINKILEFRLVAKILDSFKCCLIAFFVNRFRISKFVQYIS